MSARPEVVLGGPEGDLVDRVCVADERYFREHPGVTQFDRPHVPGEFAPFDSDLSVSEFPWVTVTRIGPGVRTRVPVPWYRVVSLS